MSGQKLKPLRRLLWLTAMLSLPLTAAELQTDWIEPVEGYQENSLGAILKAVDVSPEDGSTRVTISIPKASVAEDSDMEEVVVYGRRADKSEAEINIRHEWVADYDKDNYGLILYLGKDGNIPLRLYLKGQEDAQRP
ncbi:MAG: hypothetical protein AB7U63_05905 [Porticoccaceae bacterium]